MLVHLIAHETDLQVGSIRIVIGDAHIYENHVGVATLQTQRIPFGLPTLTIRREKDGLRDLKFKDVKLKGYEHQSALKAKMVA